MKLLIGFILTLILFLSFSMNLFSQTENSVCLYDSERSRVIPVTIYHPRKENKNTRIILFNHGYDGNKNPKSNQAYAYLTRFLAEKGFYVVSIQHELSEDPLLAMSGNFMETRMPNWIRGEQNILFVIKELQKIKPVMAWNKLILIGHSNGGDMAMLCATNYPRLIDKVISLDHRRMPMPRTKSPQLYTLRGNDYEADAGVLPDEREQKEFQMTVIHLEDITHSDMGERGSGIQHELINRYVYQFVK